MKKSFWKTAAALLAAALLGGAAAQQQGGARQESWARLNSFIRTVDVTTFEEAFWTLHDEEGPFYALLLAIVHVDKVPPHIKSLIYAPPGARAQGGGRGGAVDLRTLVSKQRPLMCGPPRFPGGGRFRSTLPSTSPSLTGEGGPGWTSGRAPRSRGPPRNGGPPRVA